MSRAFESVEFNKETKTLSVVFNYDTDFVHQYKVPVKVGQGMMNAQSKGTYFHSVVRPKYTATKVAR